MSKTRFGQVELSASDYRNFLLGGKKEGYIYPTREDWIHVAHELPPFFESAQHELQSLLPRDLPSPPTMEEVVTHNFDLVSHGKTRMNFDNQLTGWSGDLPCETVVDGATIKLGGIDLALMQAGLAPQTPESKTAMPNVGHIDLSQYDHVFVSDLPRAIGHLLLLTGDPALRKEFDSFSERIYSDIAQHGTVRDIRIYQDMTDLSLAIGFVPTPLLRAPYYGPLELGPERLKSEKEIPRFVEDKLTMLERDFESAKEAGRIPESSTFDKVYARKEATELAEALLHRKDILYAHKDEEGFYLTEGRLDLVRRLTYFFNTVTKASPDSNILVCTSSSCAEVSPAYFRNRETPGRFEVANPEKKERGKVVHITFGKVDGKDYYFNDPERFAEQREKARQVIQDLRDKSLDEKVRDGTAILDAPLLGFKKKQGNETGYDTYSESLESGLSHKQVIIFAHGGYGKSILATKLAEYFLDPGSRSPGFAQAFGNLTPVILNCQESFGDLENFDKMPERAHIHETLLKNNGLTGLPRKVLDDNNFVFILDDYHKVNDDVRPHLEAAIKKLVGDGHYVVALSRETQSGVNPPDYPAFKTMKIDDKAIAANKEEYARTRIDPDHLSAFLEYVAQYGEDVTGSMQQMSNLVMIFPHENGDANRVTMYMTDPKIAADIEARRTLNKGRQTQALVDLVHGHDVERDKPKGETLSLEELHKRTIELNQDLGRKAYRDVFGKEPPM